MKKHTKYIAGLAGLLLLVAACSTPKDINYLQGRQGPEGIANTPKTITVQQGDRLSVFVKSKDNVLTEHFNISLPNMQNVLTYTVDSKGEIDFPMLGKIRLAGLTRQEAAERIKERLVSEFGTKDVVVTLDFTNLRISVLGEVNKPGTVSIDNDKINILVVRQQGNEAKTYILNLASAQAVQSPVYYLQQNDIVYVPANKTRQRQSTVNGNTIQSTSFWISIASLLTTVAVLVFK